jgi:hypothetical protein
MPGATFPWQRQKGGSGPSDASDPELGSGSGSIGHSVTVIQRQCYAAIPASGPPHLSDFPLAREKKTSESAQGFLLGVLSDKA